MNSTMISLRAVLAAAIFSALTLPALANTHAGSAAPYCNRNSISNSQPGSGTNAATLGIDTVVSSDVANFSAPPVLPNTPENTNANGINSNNPGVHVKDDPCSSLYGSKYGSNHYHHNHAHSYKHAHP